MAPEAASAPSNEQPSGALSAQMAGMLSGFALSQALYAVAKLDLSAKLLAGPRTVTELAEETGVLADPLRRVLHTLSGVGVVTHREGDRFAVTDLGATLADGTPGSLRGTALLWMETHYEAFGELLGALRTGHTGFALRHDQEFVPYLREHPEHLPSLTSAMAELNGGPRQALLSGYRLPEGEVVADVGGADGSVLAALLADEPERRGVVMDLPGVVPAATARMSAAGLADRVSVVGGDFFAGVPSADVYLLSAVLHDWPDEDCARLLARVGEAARPGARLVVIESLLPPGDEQHPSKLSDLIMLTMAGGRERTESEYTTLLGASGFVVDRIIMAPAGGYSAIEATLKAV
ncbi:methyltransferase [Nocardiopsis metallicus]|uniref:O-methyltransferase n=1 Tax=Nocardiopsis metallicus TaxID=179819 RepID=A0A840WD01_9ACTN|nr:methyltransferase [Nocardiopsis metallicus]MBB5493263.1 hypothetical protein [Nocardiopsis metallicus]